MKKNRGSRLTAGILALGLMCFIADVDGTSGASDEGAPAGTVPIDLVLPMPMFVGTPQNIVIPNLEKPLGMPRPPFYAPAGVTNVAAGKPTIDVEVMGLRVGSFVLVTFPGELSAQIGLDIKARSPHEFTFVSGCTNGYIYYGPTAAQLANVGWAQEDSDCRLDPRWQAIFEGKVAELLGKL